MHSTSIKASWLLLLFGIAAGINIAANLLELSSLVAFSKPLLMTSLAGFFWRNRSGQSYEVWLLIGLFFAFLGDCFLLGDTELFFLLGLGSFLLTQLSYTIAFYKRSRKLKRLSTLKWLLCILPFLGYYMGMLALLWNGLPDDFKLPIMIYSTVITMMAVVGTYLALQTNNGWPIAGVVLFILSDSYIAIDKFTEIELPVVRLLIMGTYISAQLAIVWSQLNVSSSKLTSTRTRI